MEYVRFSCYIEEKSENMNEKEMQMDKKTFIEALRSGRTEWEALLAQVGKERMLQPGAAGAWSVKDIIVHVMWCEREMIGVCNAHALVGSDLWDIPEDESNEIMVAQQRDRPLEEVLLEEQQVFAQLLEAVEALSDEDFNDPRRFREMPEDWIPWQILAGNSYAHYSQHVPSIRTWLQRTV
jgi:Protein of unknown function (DUF1706)